MTTEQFHNWAKKEEGIHFVNQLRDLAFQFRLQADMPKVGTEDRIWLLAKAEGVDSAIRLMETNVVLEEEKTSE